MNPAWPRNDDLLYFGKGLEAGECGITIPNVRENMHGAATCRLDLNDGMQDAFGNISIVIAKAPNEPRIIINDETDYFEADETITAVCESVDGRPAANLTWFLADKPLGPGTSEIIDSEIPESTFFTTISRLQLRLKPDDNNVRLICSASHIGFTEGTRNTSYQLRVRFRPIPLSEIHVTGLEIGNSAVIGPITIQANPTPKVQWVIDGRVMNQGEQNERFVVRDPVSIGESRFNASLQVVSLTLEDTARSYMLRATNALGTTDYKIRIGGSQEVAGENFLNNLFLTFCQRFRTSGFCW